MSEITQCPECSRQLKVPESLLGKPVRCPSCNAVFEVGAESAAPAAMEEASPPRAVQPPRDEGPAPVRRRRPVADDDDDMDEPYEHADFGDEPERPRRRRRRRSGYLAPHRGGTILALGIIGFFCLGIILGPMAWIMGTSDLRAMQEGRMDPEGEGMTRAGQILGIIVTILAVAGCGLYALFILTGGLGRHRF
jgi:predicted Zn finger-like uncharacterized protein